MLPSAVSLNLADADVGQKTGRTSRSGSVERFCCLSITGPSILLFYFSHLLQRVKVILDYSLVFTGALYFVNAVTFVYSAFVPHCGKWKGGLYEGS